MNGLNLTTQQKARVRVTLAMKIRTTRALYRNAFLSGSLMLDSDRIYGYVIQLNGAINFCESIGAISHEHSDKIKYLVKTSYRQELAKLLYTF